RKALQVPHLAFYSPKNSIYVLIGGIRTCNDTFSSIAMHRANQQAVFGFRL
ncbi:hypothetical protein LCGC14_3143310, partial [marine sediment metagenome]